MPYALSNSILLTINHDKAPAVYAPRIPPPSSTNAVLAAEEKEKIDEIIKNLK